MTTTARRTFRRASFVAATCGLLVLSGCGGRDVAGSEAIARAEAAAHRAEAAQKKAEAAVAAIAGAPAPEVAEAEPSDEPQDNYTPDPEHPDENPNHLQVGN